jgi:hypothetical protein
MFSLPFGGRGQGMTDDEPIALPKVKANDFDLFLSVLYPMWVNLSPVCVRVVTENIFTEILGSTQLPQSAIGLPSSIWQPNGTSSLLERSQLNI